LGFSTHDTHKEYDWYDINENIVHRTNNGVEVSQNKFVSTGKLRTTTWYNSSIWADFRVDDPIEQEGYGGVTWTSSNGQGKETKRGTGKVSIENIDLLMNAVSGMGTALQMGSGGYKIPEALMNNKPVLEGLDILSKTVDSKANVVGNLISVAQVAVDNLGGKKTPSNLKAVDTVCTGGCNEAYHSDYPGLIRDENKKTIGTVDAKTK